jgi:molybdenum cofactor biosynthesis enzyme
MTELLDQVRFDIEWQNRNHPVKLSVDDIINTMTPLELLAAISAALETIRKEDRS